MANAKSIFEALNRSSKEEDKQQDINEGKEKDLKESKTLSSDSKVDVVLCEKCDRTFMITEESSLDCSCGNVMRYLTSFESSKLDEMNVSIFEDGEFFNVELEEISEEKKDDKKKDDKKKEKDDDEDDDDEDKKKDKPSKEELMKRFGDKKAKPFKDDDDKKDDKKDKKDDKKDKEKDDKKDDKKKDDKKKNESEDIEKDLELISEKLQYLGILPEYKDELKEKKADSLKKMLWENYYIKI